MQCPYCKGEMVKGNVWGDRYRLKWMPEEASRLPDGWGTLLLGGGGGNQRPRVEAYVCQSCQKLLIDLENE